MENEDFGYMIEKERSKKILFTFKKPLKLLVVLFSVFCFILITLSAYYFSRNGGSKGVKIVKAPKFEIKTKSKISDLNIKNLDKTIYDSVSGNDEIKQTRKEKIKIIKPPKAAPVETKSDKKIIIPDNKIKKEADKIVAASDMNKITKPYSRVQLAALTSKDSAYKYWLKLKKDYPNLFEELKYFIKRADLGSRGIFYRLQVGNFRNQIVAEEFCISFIAKSKKKRSDCIIVE